MKFEMTPNPSKNENLTNTLAAVQEQLAHENATAMNFSEALINLEHLCRSGHRGSSGRTDPGWSIVGPRAGVGLLLEFPISRRATNG